MSTIRGLEFDISKMTQEDLATDNLWGQNCIAFNIQADLKPQAIAALVSVQIMLDIELPGQYIIPSNAMHISVLNIIHSRSTLTDEAKSIRWKDNKHLWLRTISDVVQYTKPFGVKLNNVVAVPSGILVAANECKELIALRQRLVTSLKLDMIIPELCHVTILRFSNLIPDINKIRQVIDNLNIDIFTCISEVRISRELVYPSLKSETVYLYDLSKGNI